jgi:hypothetical protein
MLKKKSTIIWVWDISQLWRYEKTKTNIYLLCKAMKTKFINSFSSKKKQVDKVIIDIRISTITFLHFDLDLSLKKVKFVLVNFGFEITW